MRPFASALCAVILAGGAVAAPGSGQEQPARVSVESTPGGAMTSFNNPTEAQAACTSAGGGFGLRERRFVCVNPRSPLQSTSPDSAGPAAAVMPAPRQRRRMTPLPLPRSSA